MASLSDLRFNWSALPCQKFCSSACVYTGCPLSGVIQSHLQMRLESRSLAFVRGGLFKLIRRHCPGETLHLHCQLHALPAPPPLSRRQSPQPGLLSNSIWPKTYGTRHLRRPRVYCHFSMFGFIFRPTGAFWIKELRSCYWIKFQFSVVLFVRRCADAFKARFKIVRNISWADSRRPCGPRRRFLTIPLRSFLDFLPKKKNWENQVVQRQNLIWTIPNPSVRRKNVNISWYCSRIGS